MKYFLLLALLFAAGIARADNVDSFTWNPTLNKLQAITHKSGTIQVNTDGSDNSTATRLGQKQYVHGTTYNGGNAPTVSLTATPGSITTVQRAVFIPYQLNDGAWRMRFNISLVLSSASRSSILILINGVTFLQGVTQKVDGVSLSTTVWSQTYANPNTGQIEEDYASAQTTTSFLTSGDVALDSKPTWAY